MCDFIREHLIGVTVVCMALILVLLLAGSNHYYKEVYLPQYNKFQQCVEHCMNSSNPYATKNNCVYACGGYPRFPDNEISSSSNRNSNNGVGYIRGYHMNPNSPNYFMK